MSFRSTRFGASPGRDSGPGPVIFDHEWKQLLAELSDVLRQRRREINARRHEIFVERVAEREEQAAILSRNEESALQINRDRDELRKVNDAIRRVDSGEYGICLNCLHHIAPRRLRAVPTAELCAACQERSERYMREDR